MTVREAFLAQDSAKFCEIYDTSDLDESVKESDRQDLKKLLDEDGLQEVCERVVDEQLFDGLSAEEKADAKSFRVVRVKINGNKATAQVRTHNDETDATFRRVDGEWKFLQSHALG